MIEKAHLAEEEAAFIVVAGGTNDWDFQTPIGTMADIELDTMGTPSLYFGISKAIKNLLEYYPLVNYLFIIPTPRNQPTGAGDQHTIRQDTGKTLMDICQIIRELCEYYSIPYLDMMKMSNMHLENEIARNKYTTDGLHPTDYYNEKIYAPLVIDMISKYMN